MARSRPGVSVGHPPRAGPHRLGQQPGRQPVVFGPPAFADVEHALGQDDPARGPAQLGAVGVPAGHRGQQRGPLVERLGEHAAQELAQDERVHDGGPVLGLDRRRDVRRAAAEPVMVAGQVGLVGTRAVVVGAPGVHRQAQRHRVHRAGLVAGQLQALDLRRELRRAAADPLRRAPRALGEQVAQPLPGADLVQRPAAARPRRRTAARARRSGRARRTPWPRRSCRRPRSCPGPARRSARWRRARRRGRTPRTSGRARRRSRTPPASACRRGRE